MENVYLCYLSKDNDTICLSSVGYITAERYRTRQHIWPHIPLENFTLAPACSGGPFAWFYPKENSKQLLKERHVNPDWQFSIDPHMYEGFIDWEAYR